jgi:hypothetical protein
MGTRSEVDEKEAGAAVVVRVSDSRRMRTSIAVRVIASA